MHRIHRMTRSLILPLSCDFAASCLRVFVLKPAGRWRRIPPPSPNFFPALVAMKSEYPRRSKGEGEMAEQERTGVTTMRGNPLTLIGPALKPGDKAPEFQCVAQDLSPVSLSNSAGKAR